MPIAFLLHGVYGSHWAWIYKGGIHQTAIQLIKEDHIRPMVLVMPSDGLWNDGSGYLPHPNRNYEKWIINDVFHTTIETVEYANTNSPLFIAGLSMGG